MLAYLPVAPSAAQSAPDAGERPRPAFPGTPQLGVRGTPALPGTDLLESDTDWSGVDDAQRTDPRYRLKNVPIDLDGAVRASAGLLGRFQYKAYDSQNFGANPGHNGYLGYRISPWASLTYADRFRVFAQLKTGDDRGNRYFVPPTDRERIDFHQAFVELTLGKSFGRAAKDMLFRVGRQEVTYGSGLLVSLREGPNLRQSLDGALVRLRTGHRVTDAFAFYGVRDVYGEFDNTTDTGQTLAGFYSSGQLGQGATLDLYAVRATQRNDASRGSANEENRVSIGARLASRGAPVGWIWSGEAIAQFGTVKTPVARDAIRAWIGEALLARRLGRSEADPLIGIRAVASSGDGDPANGRIETFKGPLSRGPLFQNVNGIGLGNVTEVTAYGEVTLALATTLTGYALGTFRTSRRDGIYTVQGAPLRGADGSQRLVGWQTGTTLTHAIADGLTAFAEAGWFFAGPYLRDNPPSTDTGFVRTGVTIQY